MRARSALGHDRALSGALDGAAGPRTADLRLAVGAGAGWLAVLIGLDRSAGWVFVLGSVGGGLGLVALLAARGRAALAPLALAGFCVALVSIPLAARLAHARASPLASLARQRAAVTAELTVNGDPHLLRAKGVAGSPRVAVDATVESVRVAGHAVPGSGPVLVLAPAAPWRDILPGQRVRLDGTLQPALSGDLLTATLMARSDPKLLGRPPWWQRIAGTVRASLRRASAGLPEQPRGLLPGLVDGDTSQLDPVLAEHFRLAGLTHLIAVSGTNCSIIIGTALLVLRRFRAGPRTCAVVGGAVLLGFVVVARPSPSVLRAALMAAIALVALATGRGRAALPMLSAAVLGLLLWRPQLAADAGFAMSVLATAALLLLAPRWAAALRRRRVPPVLAESVAVAAAAHLVTAPVIAALAGRVSIVAIPANVLAEPVVAVTTIIGFSAALVAPLWLGAGALMAELAGWPCRWLVGVGNFFGGLHGATLPWPGGVTGGLALLGATAALAILARRTGPRRALAAAAAVAVIVQVPVRSLASGWPPTGWVFVACDVGQGDGLVLPAGPHSAVVVDSGPEPVAIDRCLADLAITDVPLLVFTHYHLDHVGGIAGVFHGRHVESVVTGPLDEPASGYDLVRDVLAKHGLRIGRAPAGQSVDIGAVRLDVLAPAAAFHGTRSDPNNSSVVMIATVGGVRIMLPGDVEIEAQQALLASGVNLRADVLKVPHHGSAYSDPRFLAAVHAKVAVISVGLHNDYGHPSPVLLADLARLGLPVRRTDHDGDVAIVSHDGALSTVVRGTRASTVGLAASVRHATMEQCPPAHRPLLAPTAPTSNSPRSSRSSAKRTCSPPEPSSRSPPAPGRPTRTRTSGNAPALGSTPPSSTTC